MHVFYVAPGFEFDPEPADSDVGSMGSTAAGDENYPGNAVPTEHLPGVGPGERGVLNAISPKYFDATDLVDIDPKPPVLWVHGEADQIVSDSSFFDAGFLGQLGELPGWPGEAVYPPQPMTDQTRDVLETDAANGGTYVEESFTDVGHSPHIERPGQFRSVLLDFLRT